MRLFGTIEKVEEQADGTLKVSGIASSEAVDSDGEVIKAAAMAAAIPDYMKFGALREMHQPLAAGTALSCEVQEDGRTYLEALVVDPVACKKVLTGTYKGFSIGGKVTKRVKNIIEGIKLTEISLVDRPANPEAVFSLAKMEDGMDAEEIKPENPAEPQAQPQAEAEKSEVPDLKKFMGEEVWDAMTAINALDAIMYLLGKESAEAGEPPEQVAALKAVVENLKRFIASEIMEDNSTECGDADALTMAAKTGDLGKKLTAAKQAAMQDAHDQLTALHKSMGDCMDKMAGIWKGDDVAMAEPTGDLTKAADALAKAAQLEEDLIKAEGERDDALTKAQKLQLELDTLKAQKPLKAVPVDKVQDGTQVKKSEETDEIPLDPVAAMRKVHQSGGRLITTAIHRP